LIEFDIRKFDTPINCLKVHKYDCCALDIDPSGTKIVSGAMDK